jgi:transaldolase
MTNTIKRLHTEHDQSVWQDDISRNMLRQGTLRQRIEEIGIRGVTSNPTIFQKAIAAGHAYDDDIKRMLGESKAPIEIFDALAVQDIQDACDLFRPMYDESDGGDGFVSLEVRPNLARDTEGTMKNARALWRAVDRPNLMVKVPGTAEGAPAIEQLLAEGININVTLLFSLENYERVARAYVSALRKRDAAGQPIDRVASVASFFVSRVDTAADALIDERIAEGSRELVDLKGKAAVANARMAYKTFEKIFGEDEFTALAEKGAGVQRPLWASTGTKNPEYSDVLYVDSLIGPHTVNTMPLPTIEAFLDHGTVARTVDQYYDEAETVLSRLAEAGISIDEITAKLEDEGIDSFAASYDELIAGVEDKKEALATAGGA